MVFRLFRQEYTPVIGIILVVFAIPDALLQFWLMNAIQSSLPPELLQGEDPIPLQVLSQHLPLGAMLAAALTQTMLKLLLLAASALLIASRQEQEEASASLLIVASFTLLPRLVWLWLRVFGHILAGLLTITPAIERFFAARFAYCELVLENKPAREAISSADHMANGWRWQLAGILAAYMLVSALFVQVWPVLTTLLSGHGSILWMLFQEWVLGLIHFTLFSVYVWCWLEARQGLKPDNLFQAGPS